jgi:hypothetical protein
MTQREQIREEEVDTTRRVNIYDTPERRDDRDDYRVIEPADHVRWGAVIAGIFATITTLLGLAVLGLAVGLSAFDAGTGANDPLSAFGVGAGVWGLISGLIAFGLGGYMAGATARTRGGDRGALQGAMVWIVTIPLTLILLGSGISGLLNIAANTAGAVGAVVDDPAVVGQQQPGEAAPGTVQQPTPGQIDQATQVGERTAWSTMLWLGLSAAAAMVGGLLGGQIGNTRRTVVRSS